MTMHLRTNNSIRAAKRFTVRKLLRSALAMGFVTSTVASVSAQSGLTLPSFPEDPSVLSLPVSQDASLPIAFAEPSQSFPSTTSATTSKRVASLLGLKKLTVASTPSQSTPTLALPSFPSTEPTPAKLEGAPKLAAEGSQEPTIFRSTSGRLQISDTEESGDEVVQASADESLSLVTIPPALIQSVPEDIEIETESLEVPVSEVLGESLGESLSNIEIPKVPTQEVQQRLPELLKRSPAMQLHIGGGPSSTADNAQRQSGSTNFSLSDSSENESNESDSAKSRMQSSGTKTMNVRIEGEPVVVQAPIVSQPSVLSQLPVIAARPVVTEPPVVAQTPVVSPAPIIAHSPVVAEQIVAPKLLTTQPTARPTTQLTTISEAFSTASTNATPKNLVFDPTNPGTGHNSPGDKGPGSPPTIGERLEVGLHEAVNVDTAQPISGLSVEHPEYCQVLKSSDRSLSFVGLKTGQTRVALFTTNPSGERKIEIREVVIAGAESRQADRKALATEISRSVHRMYPNSRIEVIAEEDGLTVQGYAGSEEEAKKIIGLVRRTSLQPVVDRLATYK